MLTDIIGWVSALVLAATISRQVYTQWKSRSVAGVSRWLFVGQLAASTGFVMYSVMLKNWVYVCSNTYILLTAIVGQCLYLRNQRMKSNRAPQI